MAAMKAVLGAKRVAPPEDLSYSPAHDILDDKVYERKMKEAKDRVCFANHYVPRCATFTYAQAHYQQRSMDAPYGDPSKEVLREIVACHGFEVDGPGGSIVQNTPCSGGRLLDRAFPTPMLQFQS
jgi:hypothetical protein